MLPAFFWLFEYVFAFFPDFFCLSWFIFEPKIEKIYMSVFFYSFYATDFNFGTKDIERLK